MKSKRFDPRPGILCWVLLLATAIACDSVLIWRKKPTMSRTLGHYLRTPFGPILAGLVGGLSWHLLEAEPFEFAAEDEPIYPL